MGGCCDNGRLVPLIRRLLRTVPLGLLGGLLIALGSAQAGSGVLDPSFGDGGRLTGQGDPVEAMAVERDGKFIQAGLDGYDREDGSSYWAVYRYNADGTPDTTFGHNGEAEGIFPDAYTFEGAFDVALQPDGKIVA